MNILVIGSGGREHAIVHALYKSESTEKIYSAPGNPGMFQLSEKAAIDVNNFDEIAGFCVKNMIDLVVIGPEQPLEDGLVDHLKSCGIDTFGPVKAAAKIESSKDFAKILMRKKGVPTASYRTFSHPERELAHKYIDESVLPLVLKADGLAQGKGVIIAESYTEAHSALDEMFNGLFGKAGSRVLIEEFMDGEEASIFAICDGKDYVLLASSQDHKRALDGDQGKNTGGMGAYAPAPIVNNEIIKSVESKIIKPILEAFSDEGTPYIGCLYAGLMIKNNNPKVVEFNCRFGDPETQAVLAVFEGDFARLLKSAAAGKIDKSTIQNTQSGTAVCVVGVSNGYPDSYDKGFEIRGIEEAEQSGSFVYHAGTKIIDDTLVTNGGRVFGVTAKAANINEARDIAYKSISKIHFENLFYRRDIGIKGIEN